MQALRMAIRALCATRIDPFVALPSKVRESPRIRIGRPRAIGATKPVIDEYRQSLPQQNRRCPLDVGRDRADRRADADS